MSHDIQALPITSSRRISPMGTLKGIGLWFDLTQKKACIAIYLAIALPTLSVLCLLTGPFQTIDEPSHYYRAVQLSEGKVLPVISPSKDSAGDYLDTSAVRVGSYYQYFALGRWMQSFGASKSDFHEAQALKASSRRVFVRFSNTVIYAPPSHLVPAAAIFVARTIGLSPLNWMYAGRLANSLAAITIFALSIAIFEEGRLFIFVMALLPRVLFGTAALSADALLIPLSALHAANICRLGRDDSVSLSCLALLTLSTVFICIGKIAYLPLVVIAPCIRFLRVRRVTNDVVYLCALVVFTTTVWILWNRLIAKSVFPIRHDVKIDIYGQLHSLLLHPLQGPLVVARSIFKDGFGYIDTLAGGMLASADTRIPHLFVAVCFAFLVVGSFNAAVASVGKIPEFCVAVACASASAVAVFVLLYMQYTAFGSAVVDGVQGRYFLPLLPVLVAFMPKTSLSPPKKILLGVIAAGWFAFTSGYTVRLVAKRYWHEPPVAGLRFDNPQIQRAE